jgi:hypothetical protein
MDSDRKSVLSLNIKQRNSKMKSTFNNTNNGDSSTTPISKFQNVL